MGSALGLGLARDLRLALRQLRQTPVVSTVALVSLALGIGANVAIFSLVNALMLKALPVHEPDRLVALAFKGPSVTRTSFTNPQWEYVRDHQEALAGTAAVGYTRFDLGAGGEARMVPGLYASAGLLGTLGVAPVIGRPFTADEDRRGGPPVAIVSHGFWQRELGGDPAVVGRTIALDGHAFSIVGVTPPSFFGIRVGATVDILVPLGSEPIIRGAESGLDRRSMWWLTIIGRLAPGQSAADAEAKLRAFQPRLRDATMPQEWRPQDRERYLSDTFTTVPAATGLSLLRDRYRQPLLVLLGCVGLVLAVACANMANLLLAQSMARRKELAVRLSLGAGRGQLVRQLLVESLMLSTLGATAGLLVAGAGARALVAMLSTRTNLVHLDLSMDWRVFAFTAAVAVLTGLLFGVAPAVRGTALVPADVLRDHARGIVGGGRLHVGHLLVAAQVALSFVLVCGSVLFVRTLVGLTSQGLGFSPDRVLLATLDLRRTGVDEGRRSALFHQVRDAVAGVPGVEAAALSFVTPIGGMVWSVRIAVPGFDAPETERVTLYNVVSPDYFRALGTPRLGGRDIAAADAAGRPHVAVVNEAFARKFFAGQNPVGQSFLIERFSRERADVQVEVVGLVVDAKYETHREEAQPTVYAAMAQQDSVATSVRLAVKTTGPPMESRRAVVDAVAGVNRDIVVNLRTLDEDLASALTEERLVAALSSVFGGLALGLAALGLYGVMSCSVGRRTSEIGIRMALGAEPARVMRLVFGHVGVITAAGLVAGGAAALGAGRLVNAMLFNLSADDRTVLALTAITLGVTACLAGYLPARRASRTDPMRALREP